MKKLFLILSIIAPALHATKQNGNRVRFAAQPSSPITQGKSISDDLEWLSRKQKWTTRRDDYANTMLIAQEYQEKRACKMITQFCVVCSTLVPLYCYYVTSASAAHENN
jgi:hypothetical protein